MPESNDTEPTRYWAISHIGYGQGHTPGEAIENYVAAQLRNLPARSTIYETPKRWEAALRTGEAKADVWHAPEGTTGFVTGFGLKWRVGDEYVDAEREQLLDDRKKG